MNQDVRQCRFPVLVLLILREELVNIHHELLVTVMSRTLALTVEPVASV
jgi:hypothetical protein